MSVLVVSATETEARYVPDGTSLLVTGIGKVPASTAVSTALALDPSVDLVVNIGSCGALRDDLTGIFEIGRVLNHDFSAEAVRALGHQTNEWLTVGSSIWTLATGDLFVADPAVRARLAAHAHLVDMEGYAVAWAARQAGVAVRLVKHVSDNADDSARDWAAVADESARELGDWLRANL